MGVCKGSSNILHEHPCKYGCGQFVMRKNRTCRKWICLLGLLYGAMMAGDRFKGRWLLGEEFSYLERPANLPIIKEISRPERWNERPPDSGDERNEKR
jgi:hypothetical protein